MLVLVLENLEFSLQCVQCKFVSFPWLFNYFLSLVNINVLHFIFIFGFVIIRKRIRCGSFYLLPLFYIYFFSFLVLFDIRMFDRDVDSWMSVKEVPKDNLLKLIFFPCTDRLTVYRYIAWRCLFIPWSYRTITFWSLKEKLVQ